MLKIYREFFQRVFDLLPDDRKNILLMRSGLNGEKLTYKEISEHFGVTPERIRQIEAREMHKLESLVGTNKHYFSAKEASAIQAKNLIRDTDAFLVVTDEGFVFEGNDLEKKAMFYMMAMQSQWQTEEIIHLCQKAIEFAREREREVVLKQKNIELSCRKCSGKEAQIKELKEVLHAVRASTSNTIQQLRNEKKQ